MSLGSAGGGKQKGARLPPFESLAEALDGARSEFFGIGADGRPRHGTSYYGADTPYLTFDVSNNQILCSITASGLLENACVLADLAPAGLDNRQLPGIYVYKELIGSSAWPLAIRRRGAAPVRLHEIPGVTVDLLGDLFPAFTCRHDRARIRFVAFAPTTRESPSTAPRAVLVVLQIENEGDRTLEAAILGPPDVPALRDVDIGSGSVHQEAVTCLDGGEGDSAGPAIDVALDPGREATLCLAFVLGHDAEELHRTGRVLRERTALEWLNETWESRAERLGRLAIPDAPFSREALVRFEELCRQSVLRLADGKFGAGFWGSNFVGASAWESRCIWNKDNFHAMLPMSMLEPRLCADAILFFLRWGLPTGPYGRGVGRFGDPRRVTHSLTNALSSLVLAGAYYQMTGDTGFFQSHPEILDGARDILEDVVQSRQGEPFLFPSMYISDGDSRGDYHTGSNLLVWHSFHNMARIAREAYGEADLAAEWCESAARVKDEILNRCVGESSLGRRLFEGANADGTLIACHDGEETDTTLMPFYGFCEPDDPALLNHARLGVSPENPYYAPGVDGIWWENTAATFPGWMTALASASNEDGLHNRLGQIRRLTDHDGSIWWWPYPYGCSDPTEVRRRDPYYTWEGRHGREELGVGKCGWAAGVYLCLFIHTILGLRVDVPARRVSLRPFCPWPEFTWERCRLGSAVFDVAYARRDGRLIGRLTNHNDSSFEALIELMAPDGAAVTECTIDGLAGEDVDRSERYGRPAVRAVRSIAPGDSVCLEMRCDDRK